MSASPEYDHTAEREPVPHRTIAGGEVPNVFTDDERAARDAVWARRMQKFEDGTTQASETWPPTGASVALGVVEPAESVLAEAERIVNGPRRAEYGGCLESFERIAAMWSAYLGVTVSAEDVSMLMVLLKTCRAKQGMHRDSIVDVAGYVRCVELMQAERAA